MIWRIMLISICIVTSSVASAFEVPEQYRNGVTVVHSESMPPISFFGINGEPKGYLIDFWRKWSKETGVPVNFYLTSWKKGLEMVRDGEGIIHGGLSYTAARDNYLDFVDETFRVTKSLFVSKQSSIMNFNGLAGTTVGVLEKGQAQSFLSDLYPGAKLKVYPNSQAEIDALVRGEVDSVFILSHVALYLLGQSGARSRFHEVVRIREKPLYAAVKEGDRVLADLVLRGMQEIDDNERRLILERWNVTESSVSPFLKIGVGLALLVLVSCLGGLLLSGRRT